MQFNEDTYQPARSVVYEANKGKYIPLFVGEPPRDDDGHFVLPDGILQYTYFQIGFLGFTLSVANNDIYSQLLDMYAYNIEDPAMRAPVADSFMVIKRLNEAYSVLFHPKEELTMCDPLMSSNNLGDVVEFYENTVNDVKGGGISLTSRTGILLFHWEGPPLLPVSLSTSPHKPPLN